MILTAFSLAQIGELTTRLSDEFQAEYADIPWKQIRGMRNLIVYDYDGINLRILESTVENDLPELRARLRDILDAERAKGE